MDRSCLIVDPSTMVRRVASRIIKDLGLDVIEARSGEEALDICADRMPSAILFDWILSDMDASLFLAQLSKTVDRQSAATPTLIFCSGERNVERIVDALRAGADEYIMKPFDSDIIQSKFALAGLIEEAPCVAA